MKVVCDCGNEMTFELDKEMEEDEYGLYAKTDNNKFSFWAEHEQTGIVCEKCKKAIWYFT